MYDDEDDEDDELYDIDLPRVDPTTSYLISQFFIEQDRKEKLLNMEVAKILDRLFSKHGELESSISVMNYVSNRRGWDIEILMEKHEVEDHLLAKYDIYDDDIWRKVIGTAAMSDLRREVFALTQTYLDRAVQEALGKERPSTSGVGDPLL